MNTHLQSRHEVKIIIMFFLVQFVHHVNCTISTEIDDSIDWPLCFNQFLIDTNGANRGRSHTMFPHELVQRMGGVNVFWVGHAKKLHWQVRLEKVAVDLTDSTVLHFDISFCFFPGILF